MKQQNRHVPIEELHPAPAAGPAPGWRAASRAGDPGPDFVPADPRAREVAQFRTQRVNIRISGLAAKRLEAAAYRLGHPNLNAVAKAILEASAGVEAEEFYSLLAEIVAFVQRRRR